MKFRVRGVTEQKGLKIVQVEPLRRWAFLLEDEIPLCCIQHIISNILKHGKESKEYCNKMSKILCNIYMDDDSSRRKHEHNTSTMLLHPTADNKDIFRRYRGVEILIEMLKTHRDPQIAKALSHVIKENCN